MVVACPSRPLSSSVMRPSSSRTLILRPLIVICNSIMAVQECMLNSESVYMLISRSLGVHQLVRYLEEQLVSIYKCDLQAP